MSKRILIIEDDVSTSQFLSYTMECEGFQTLTVGDGLEGLKKAQTENPDLIILDIMLPGLDGFEICHCLRAYAPTADIPVLMLSAKAQEADRNTGLRMGADDYIVKPAAPETIVAAVNDILNKNCRGRSNKE